MRLRSGTWTKRLSGLAAMLMMFLLTDSSNSAETRGSSNDPPTLESLLKE